MATVYRCDICKNEKENREGYLVAVVIPLAGRYDRTDDANDLDSKSYDLCVECAKALNSFLEERKKTSGMVRR